MHKYRLLAKKGEGTFSEVLKAQCIKTGKYVAIKCMKVRRRPGGAGASGEGGRELGEERRGCMRLREGGDCRHGGGCCPAPRIAASAAAVADALA
eukprot:353710-Chlamydomonas_euryale.AAC.8